MVMMEMPLYDILTMLLRFKLSVALYPEHPRVTIEVIRDFTWIMSKMMGGGGVAS